MFERLDRRTGAVIVQARNEARLLGAAKLEAEHLLLALSRRTASDAGRVLASVGLDHEGLRSALDAELRRSLDAAGVGLGTIALAEPPLPTTGEPRWGESSKRALQRALGVAKERGDRAIRPVDILVGVLRAEEGTVPRALAFAGVDAPALAAAALDESAQ